MPRYMEKDLSGPISSSADIYKTTLKMAWPAVVESVLVALVGFMDSLMVSVVGTNAIAAVGLVQQPKLLFLAPIISMNVGVTAIVSRRIGAEKPEEASRCMRQFTLICAVISLIMSVIGVAFARQIVLLAGAKSDTVNEAADYMRIIIAGQFFQCIGLTINAAMRGAGNTKISMRTNVVANLVNVALNYLLIGGNLGFPRLEVRGAAIATAVGSLAAFVLSAVSVLSKKSRLPLYPRKSWIPDRDTSRSLAIVSASACAEQLCMRIGFFTYALIVANLGTRTFATHQIGMNVLSISFSFGDGLAVAAAALVGQSIGAGRHDLAMIYGKVCQRISIFMSAMIVVICITLRYPIVGMFTDDPFVLSLGAKLMIVTACVSHAQTTNVVYSNALRAAGDTRFVALIALVSIMVVRPTVSWLLCYPAGFGLIGAWIGLMVDQYSRGILNVFRFTHGKWKYLRSL